MQESISALMMPCDPAGREAMFDKVVWGNDRAILNELVFRFEQTKSEHWDGGEHFLFYKTKYLIDQYRNFFQVVPAFCPMNVLEIGLWDGGSLAFWNEILRPTMHIGLDLSLRGDSDYFKRYIDGRGTKDQVRTLWGFDQADRKRLRRLFFDEFEGRLDLVLDDGSHLYGPTLASFETLFPFMQPGGIYVIEDWAWEHWQGFDARTHPWAREVSLTHLLTALVGATGTPTELIAKLLVYQGFVAVERGPAKVENPETFALHDYIKTRDARTEPNDFGRMLGSLKRVCGGLLGLLGYKTSN